jgi:dTDP-4-dehydrorhamnose reductase
VLHHARQNKKILAITDSWGTPTYAIDLAAQLRRLAMLDVPGVFHIVNAGDGATYEEFVRTLLAAAAIEDGEVQPITCAALKRPAPRPRNCRLRCLRSDSVGLPPLRTWQEALKDHVAVAVMR